MSGDDQARFGGLSYINERWATWEGFYLSGLANLFFVIKAMGAWASWNSCGADISKGEKYHLRSENGWESKCKGFDDVLLCMIISRG